MKLYLERLSIATLLQAATAACEAGRMTEALRRYEAMRLTGASNSRSSVARPDDDPPQGARRSRTQSAPSSR